MLSPVIFLLFAMFVLWRSYRMLLELVHTSPQTGVIRKRRFYTLWINVGGLLIWFSVGVAALSISIAKFTNKVILLLQ